MLLNCPNCAASHDLDVAELSAATRISCTQCRASWEPNGTPSSQYTPFDISPLPDASRDHGLIDAEIVAEFAGRASDGFDSWSLRATRASDEPSTFDELEELARAAQAPAIAPPAYPIVAYVPPEPEPVQAAPLRLVTLENDKPKEKTKRAAWPFAAAALAASLAALFVWRTDVVRVAPQSASLYRAIGFPVNARGLSFAEIKTLHETQDGRNVLVVTGQIANTSAKPADVPRLRLSLLDAGNTEVFAWAAAPGKTTIAPGETLAFRSRIASPPATAHDVQVRFFNRQDVPL